MAEEKKNGVSVKKAHSEGNQKAKFVSRLETKYQEEIVPELKKEFGYSSIMECPKLVKIILNMRLGEAGSNSKSVEEAVKEMAIISGQHPIVTKAKKSVANFKLREGVPVGVKVTLRRVRMYDFLDKFISIDLPRVRDFRGISKDSFDGRGTILSVSKSSSSSLKSLMTRSPVLRVWMSSSSLLRRPTKKLMLCFLSSACPSRSNRRNESWLEKL